MRATIRLLASAARYPEAGSPTGLTGLQTAASPRSALLYLYALTLDRLSPIPETSLYRQSVEAVTRHRMSLVQATKPAGWDAWQARAQQLLESREKAAEDKAALWAKKAREARDSAKSKEEEIKAVIELTKARDSAKEPMLAADGTAAHKKDLGAAGTVVFRELKEETDIRNMEWNDGYLTPEEMKKKGVKDEDLWEDEPQLTLEQIEELEKQIGAGLIEEVIQVAEGELKAVDTMVRAKVWENLEDKPSEDQWVYFERKE